MPPLSALRSESHRQPTEAHGMRKERRLAHQNDFRSHRWRTRDRAGRTDDSGSGPRQREADSHALLSEGPERGGRLPRVHGGACRHGPPAAGLHHADAGWHVDQDHFGEADAIPPMAVELLLVERNHICSAASRTAIASCRRWLSRWALRTCATPITIRGSGGYVAPPFRARSQSLHSVHALRAGLRGTRGSECVGGGFARHLFADRERHEG